MKSKRRSYTIATRVLATTLSLLVIFSLTQLYPHKTKKLVQFLQTTKNGFVTLSQVPDIRLYKNFITEEQAKHLIALSKNRLTPSLVLQNGKGNRDIHSRSSSTAYLNKSEDKVIQKIEQKVSQLLGCPIEYIEPIQVVHYSKGQIFSPHYDYFTQEELPHQHFQRAHTLLIYLNDVAEKDGGATFFPDLNIRVQPKIKTALYFKQLDDNGHVQPLTLHGGEEIKNENIEKWACNIWIREKPYGSVRP